MAAPQKKQQQKAKAKSVKVTPGKRKASPVWYFLLPVLAVTFILYIPALKNGFTNWDDILYVTQNPLLQDLSLKGLKAIWTTPVVSNYHPLTILSLALNYRISALDPMSYHFSAVVLHVLNTGLVFWFIWVLSSGNKWVSVLVALLFGIHPMHTESVAWVSERKDLLYTLFYVAAMIVYVRYIRSRQVKDLVVVTLLGALSLLCKPAAIVLPLSLLAIDFYLRRKWNWSWIVEKLPLFIMSGIIAYVTLIIQSHKAIASVEYHSIVDRICFAGYGWIWYLIKLIVPYPLSGLHPFPQQLTILYYLGTAASALSIVYLVWKVKNRNVLFGFGFYTINLLLVLQLISIGNAVVAERYSYVPYIGIFFMLGMEGYQRVQHQWSKYKNLVIGVAAIWMIGLALLTWKRIPVWENSQTLWEDVLKNYPNSARAWTNKGLDYYDQKKWPEVIDHLTKALAIDPKFKDALEWRSRAYLEQKAPDKALQDAMALQKLNPQHEAALFLLARAQEASGQSEVALTTYTDLISTYPTKPEYFNNRGVIYFNKLQKIPEAKADFEKAIEINPKNGSYYVNMSRCNYMQNDIDNARKNAVKGKLLGAEVDINFAKLIGID